MHMGTTRWAVAGMGIGSTDTTLSVTQFSTAAQSAALAPRKEAPSVIPGSSSRSADVYLANWMRGQLAALDIRHIYHTAANISWNFHYSRIVGEERKMVAHSGACRAAGVTFIPPCRGISGRLERRGHPDH